MDFDLRQWLLILGPVFIVGVLLHGYLRVRAGQNDIKMKLDKSFLSTPGEEHKVDDLSLLKAELPNGGARIIETIYSNKDSNKDSNAPVLMESVDMPTIRAADPALEIEALLEPETPFPVNPDAAKGVEEARSSNTAKAAEQNPNIAKAPPAQKTKLEPSAGLNKNPSAGLNKNPSADRNKEPSAGLNKEPSAGRDKEPSAGLNKEPSADRNKEPSAGVFKKPSAAQNKEPSAEPAESNKEPPSTDQPTTPEKFVVINVLALGEEFAGQRLLEILVESGMTFGEMDIFHKLDSAGEPSFSLASAVEPGFFNMSTIDTFSTPGITMFMRVHELSEPLVVLDELLEVAESIAHELGGEIRDETRSVLTPQTVEYCRQSIREFQFKHSA